MVLSLSWRVQAVSFPTQNGCHLSRAQIRTFAHNDVADLKRVLDAVAAEDRRVRCKPDQAVGVFLGFVCALRCGCLEHMARAGAHAAAALSGRHSLSFGTSQLR